MTANTIWDFLVSARYGCERIIRGAFSDSLALPGRCLVPVAALLKTCFEIESPALSAIVSGDLFPNIVVFGSLLLVTVSASVLYKTDQPRLIERAVLWGLLFAQNVSRALFSVDAIIQSAVTTFDLFGCSHILPEALQHYSLQVVLVSVHLIPSFIIPIHVPDILALQLLFNFVFTCIRSASFIRIAQHLEVSKASFLAALCVAFSAKFAADGCILDALKDILRPGMSHRVDAASRASFFAVLSWYTGRWFIYEGLACFFLLEMLSPWSIQAFIVNRIMVPSFRSLTNAAVWLYQSAWPMVKPLLFRCFFACVDFLCKGFVPFRIMYQLAIVPLWNAVSPLIVPSVVAYIAFTHAANYARLPSLHLLVTDGVVAAAAALSSLVLYTHAFSRLFRNSFDVFKFELIRWMCARWCDCMVLPITVLPIILRAVWNTLLRPVVKFLKPYLFFVLRCVSHVLGVLLDVARMFPIFSVISIILTNVAVLYAYYSSPLASYIFVVPFWSQISSIVSVVVSNSVFACFSLLVRLSSANAPNDQKDVVLAVCVIAFAQMTSCFFIRKILRNCRPLTPASSQQHQMAPDELQILAESMSQPRQVSYASLTITLVNN